MTRKRRFLAFAVGVTVFGFLGYRWAGYETLTPLKTTGTAPASTSAPLTGQQGNPLALARRCDTKTLLWLLEGARSGSEERAIFLQALASVTNVALRSQIIAELQNERDSEVQHSLRASLLQNPSAHLASDLLKAYNSTADEQAQSHLIDCLDAVQTVDALPVFAEILHDAKTPLTSPLSRTARRVLSKVGTGYAIEVLANRMVQASEDELPVLAASLASIKASDAILELSRIAEGQRPEWATTPIRVAATHALQNYPNGSSTEVLEKLTQDADEQVASTARALIAQTKR